MSGSYLNDTTNEEKIIDYMSTMTDNFIKRQYAKYCEKELWNKKMKDQKEIKLGEKNVW